MAKFRTYAEVLRSDYPQVAAHKAGLTGRPPGLVLGEVLERTGGAYETTLPLAPHIATLLGDFVIPGDEPTGAC